MGSDVLFYQPVACLVCGGGLPLSPRPRFLYAPLCPIIRSPTTKRLHVGGQTGLPGELQRRNAHFVRRVRAQGPRTDESIPASGNRFPNTSVPAATSTFTGTITADVRLLAGSSP